MKRVLWLASWYPGRTAPFSGDFVKRHALAVSRLQSLSLIFATKDEGISSGKISYEIQEGSALKEHIAYYPCRQKIRLLQQFSSLIYYFKAHLHLIKKISQNNGLPEIVHVQIAMKAGLVALYLKRRYGIPYVITENWTGYYPGNPDNLKGKNILYRFLVRLIFRNASVFLPVTEDLGKLVNRTITPIPFRVIPNVVDTRFFKPDIQGPVGVFGFVHISALGYQKNPEGMIRSFKTLLKEGTPAKLTIVGPVSDQLCDFISKSGLPDGSLLLTGEKKYEDVAEIIKKANALVLFSRYENLPCVMLEALCCGLPVIATKVGGIAEVINNQNGLLIDSEDEQQLLAAMKEMIDNYSRYNRKAISENAGRQFNYTSVGRQYLEVYHSVTGRPFPDTALPGNTASGSE